MNNETCIRVEWMPGGDEPFADPTAAMIAIVVDGVNLCRAENRWSRSVVEAVPLSAAPLAWWFVNSWWRLRWEPSPPGGAPDMAWRMAHELTAAGGGFVWPPIRVVSDGETIEIEARPLDASAEVLHYLARKTRRISVAAFEAASDAFVELTIERLGSDADGPALAAMWRQVRMERDDPVAADHRRLEAVLGFDPDDAPADLVESVRTSAPDDPGAQIELAAICARAPVSAVRETLAAAQTRGKPRPAVFMGLDDALPAGLAAEADRPFERGYRLARGFRHMDGFGPTAPIGNAQLGDPLGLTADALTAADGLPQAPFAVAVREAGGDRFLFRSPHRLGRRFEAARMLGDRLAFRDARLHPVAATGTARQAMQRAFAAELLAPHAAIVAVMGNDRSREAQADVAEHFGVGELTIQHQLANHGTSDFDHWLSAG